MMNQELSGGIFAQGGGYGPPPGGYGGPPGAPPGAPGGYGPPPGGMGAPPGGAPMAMPGAPAPGMGMGMAAGGGGDIAKAANTWMIIGFVSFFCGTGCFGIIGGILGYLASQAAKQGNMAEAESKLKISKIVTIIGLVLLALGAVAYGIMFVVAMANS